MGIGREVDWSPRALHCNPCGEGAELLPLPVPCWFTCIQCRRCLRSSPGGQMSTNREGREEGRDKAQASPTPATQGESMCAKAAEKLSGEEKEEEEEEGGGGAAPLPACCCCWRFIKERQRMERGAASPTPPPRFKMEEGWRGALTKAAATLLSPV